MTAAGRLENEIKDAIRQVIRTHANLSTSIDELSDEASLYAAGMTSHASVNVMIALEDELDVEFDNSLLRRSVFESVDSITQAIEGLKASS